MVLSMQRRMTKHKRDILACFAGEHLLSASELVDRLGLDPSTVYRNLERFVADGVLRKVHLDGREAQYERAEHAHGHFVCDDCRSVEVVELPSSLKKLAPRGTHPTSLDLTFHGSCTRCA